MTETRIVDCVLHTVGWQLPKCSDVLQLGGNWKDGSVTSINTVRQLYVRVMMTLLKNYQHTKEHLLQYLLLSCNVWFECKSNSKWLQVTFFSHFCY